jgi:DedD protein
MDSRAKQRLTGAVILVALFVLLVPELLTGPRNAGGDAPSEEGMRRYTIDLDAPAGASLPATPVEPDRAVVLPPVADNPPRDVDADARALPGEAAQPEAVPPTATASAPAATPAKPSPVATPMTTPPGTASNPVPAAPKPATTPTATPAPTRAETPRPATTPAVGKQGAFAVQLGSFVSRDNAERLVRQMTAKGFNAFLAPPITTGGRELWRVRVGPTRDRASAEALAAQLRRIGQGGSIVSIS